MDKTKKIESIFAKSMKDFVFHENMELKDFSEYFKRLSNAFEEMDKSGLTYDDIKEYYANLIETNPEMNKISEYIKNMNMLRDVKDKLDKISEKLDKVLKKVVMVNEDEKS